MPVTRLHCKRDDRRIPVGRKLLCRPVRQGLPPFPRRPPRGRHDQSRAVKHGQHEYEKACAARKPPPRRDWVERKPFPKRQKNESSFQDIQWRGRKAGIWTIAQSMQAPMRHQRVGNSCSNKGSQHNDCCWFCEMSNNRKPASYAGQTHAPQNERQPYGERQEPKPVRQPNSNNSSENAPQRRFGASPLLITVKS